MGTEGQERERKGHLRGSVGDSFFLVNQPSIASHENAPARHRDAETICQDSSSLAELVSYPARLPVSQIPLATETGFEKLLITRYPNAPSLCEVILPTGALIYMAG